MPNDNSDLALAHALLRLGLGTNLFLHGLVRLPELGKFAGHVEQTLAQSWLPLAAVTAVSHAIPFIELTLGALLLLGLFLRPALIAGSLFMVLLTIGVCFAQNWPVAAQQLIYMIVFALLLATARHDRYSVDRWRTR